MITTTIHGEKFQIDGQGFLSPAEELALEDWLHDMRVQDAAQKRCRSPETVSTHRKHLREKANAKSASGVLAYCLSKKIIRVLVVVGAFSGVQQFATTQSQNPFNTVRVARFSRNSRQQEVQAQC